LDGAEGGARPGTVSRRQLLRMAAFAAIGAVAVIGTGRVVAAASTSPTEGSSKRASGPAPAASAPSAIPSPSSPGAVPPAASTTDPSQEIRVKVNYFQMPFVVNTKVEYFTLTAQARYSDLLAGVVKEHPAILPMIPSMMVLIDGVPAQPATPLRDGEEIDFIPAVAGG
jgi:molybdopterin converting factor small subunit